ncbi:MAG: hypothetical protein AAGA70_11960 [Pseudomonadota bacterium]
MSGFFPYFVASYGHWPWHDAWVEYRRAQRLDRVALRDMGLSGLDRAAITVAVIQRRMVASAARV